MNSALGVSMVELHAAGAGASDAAWYEVLRGAVDRLISLTQDNRQSGRPGGNRAKAHIVLAAVFSAVAAGEALALRMAGCKAVKVVIVEAEGGLTPGVMRRLQAMIDTDGAG